MIFLYLFGSVLLIILLSAKYKIHPVISLIIVSFFLGLLLEIRAIDILKFIFEGILNSFYGIGLIIYLSCVIGQCLKKSSSLIIFSQILINTFKNKTLSSLNIIGLFIGSVVFCDSAFLVLSGLTKSISSTATYSLNSLNLSLAGGLYTSHNLIPPTPGPVAILNNLNSIELIGDVILYGFLISIPATLVSIIFASRLVKRKKIKIDYNFNVNYKKIILPFLVIIIPLLIISVNTLSELIGLNLSNEEVKFIKSFSNANFALLIGAIMSLFLPKVFENKKRIITDSFKDFYPIILLTSAGSAFGNIIKNSELVEILPLFFDTINNSLISICLICFVIGTILKTSQGSSTSAMIITSSLIFPLISKYNFTNFDIVMVTLSIGAGSMMISHVNDSYFWIVSKKSEMNLQNSLKYFSIMTVFQSLSTILFISLIILIST